MLVQGPSNPERSLWHLPYKMISKTFEQQSLQFTNCSKPSISRKYKHSIIAKPVINYERRLQKNFIFVNIPRCDHRIKQRYLYHWDPCDQIHPSDDPNLELQQKFRYLQWSSYGLILYKLINWPLVASGKRPSGGGSVLSWEKQVTFRIWHTYC